MNLKINQFSYDLPQSNIAQTPKNPRDHAKLMLINRKSQQITHHHVSDLPQLLPPHSVLVFNDTKVFPARLLTHKKTGGQLEILFIRQLGTHTWEVLTKPGIKPHTTHNITPQITVNVLSQNQEGTATIHINCSSETLFSQLNQYGRMPLPPYIHSHTKETKLRSQYQTTYAQKVGSAAAPTAGLHFTKRLLNNLHKQYSLEYVTLHVGLGTFQPLKYNQLQTNTLHTESYQLSPEVTNRLNQAKRQHHPIIAVGTTTTRVLESCTDKDGFLKSSGGETNIFIKPPYKFKFIDGLMTNFHLPESSLLMLVSAFTSYPNTTTHFTTFKSNLIGQTYQEAIKENYRFYSFGDATLIL